MSYFSCCSPGCSARKPPAMGKRSHGSAISSSPLPPPTSSSSASSSESSSSDGESSSASSASSDSERVHKRRRKSTSSSSSKHKKDAKKKERRKKERKRERKKERKRRRKKKGRKKERASRDGDGRGGSQAFTEAPDPELAAAVGFKPGGAGANVHLSAHAADPFALAKEKGEEAQSRLRDPAYKSKMRREREMRKMRADGGGPGSFDFAASKPGQEFDASDEVARRRAAREHRALKAAATMGRKAAAAEAVEKQKMAELLLKCGAGGVAEKLGLVKPGATVLALEEGKAAVAAACAADGRKADETSDERGSRLRGLSGLPF